MCLVEKKNFNKNETELKMENPNALLYKNYKLKIAN